MPSTSIEPEAAPPTNPYKPLPDAVFYAEASVLLGVSSHALRAAVASGVLSEWRTNGRLVHVWTVAELTARGVIKPVIEKPVIEKSVGEEPTPRPPVEMPPAVVPPKPSADSLISASSLCEWLMICRRTLRRYVELEIFPEPYRLSGNLLRWRRGDVEAAIAARQVGYTLPESGQANGHVQR